TTNVIVGADDLSVLFMNQNGACGQTGSIQIFISGGNPNYTITWNGPVSGSATTGSNFTISNLTNGTYSVIVADTNGCSETETITINNNANNLTVTSSVMNGVCGSNGSIQLDITGGTAPYTINWAGPISGSSSTNADEIILENFPTGTYTFTITDGSSCTTTTTATLVNPGDLDLIATAINGACGNLGSIKLDINNGTPAYTVSWQGPSSGNITTNSSQLTIPNLLAGTYTITVVDSNGCSDTASVSVVNTEDDLDVVFTPLNGACGDLGSVWIDILGGTSSYIITWTGPTSGSEVTHDNFYDIVDLPSGTYTITVLDANNCSETTVVTITNVVDDLVATFAPQAGSCGGPSSLQVSISGGTPEYTIAWNGGNSSGSLTTTETNVTIGDLTPGVYNVTVLDINGCQETGSFGLNNNGNNLVVNASPTPFNCGVFGFIDLSFVGGNPTYTITWTGPVAGSSTTSESTFRIDNLTMGAYMITVTDGFGCSRMQSVFVGEMTAAPVADFSASVTDLSVQLVNQSTSGTFTWDFGDGNNSTEPSLTHTYLSAGTYTICLTATNACGSDIHCETVTVAGNGDMVTLDVGERSGLQGATLQVPVVIENCDLMVSLSGSLALSNPSVANIVGVSGGVITPQFNLNNQTFNFYDNNGTGISLSDGDILFYLEVTLTGSAGQSTLIEITDSPLISEVGGYINSVPSSLPHLRIAGEVSVVQSGQLEGTAMTYYGTGIQSAEISMTGTDVDMLEMTDEGGYFRFPEMPVGGNYQLTAEKDMNAANGLSTYGLFIGQRFLLGIETPQITSPYQIIAADANCSNSFTTLDLFVIQQLIIGVNDAFDHCPSWVFVAEESYMPEEFDAYNVFPYAHHHEVSITDNMVKNFIGVKVGDILGHASPNMLHVEDIDDRSLELMRLQTADQTYETGELVELTFNTSDFKDIASYQMELLFDTEQLSYLGFEAPEDGPLASAIAGEAPTADGALRISWFDLMGDGINLEASAEVFTLRFKAEDKIEDLSSLFTLSSRGIRSEAHQPNGDPVKIVLEFVKDKVAVTGTGYQLHQNTPNPFTNETKIGFELPAAMDAELIIHDHLGRVVQRFEGYYDGGYNEVVWSKANLQSGVYYYTLKTADYAATLNMIILD
ncbi:MAG: PKD domain-containing protein, partial [Bacteroidota bacterium]